MLTEQQRKVYVTIRDFIASKGFSPSYSRLGKLLGLNSSATIHKHVTRLLELGYLTRPTAHTLDVVPEKMQGMDGCNRGHRPVWFVGGGCPVCEVLHRLAQVPCGKT